MSIKRTIDLYNSKIKNLEEQINKLRKEKANRILDRETLKKSQEYKDISTQESYLNNGDIFENIKGDTFKYLLTTNSDSNYPYGNAEGYFLNLDTHELIRDGIFDARLIYNAKLKKDIKYDSFREDLRIAEVIHDLKSNFKPDIKQSRPIRGGESDV